MDSTGALCRCFHLGIPIFLLCVANISGVLGEMFRFLYGKVLCKPCNMIKKRRAANRKAKMQGEAGIGGNPPTTGGWSTEGNDKDSMKKSPNALAQDPDMDDEDQRRRNERVTVPLTITMLIIAAYIWAGAMIFNAFEQWTLMQAGYFCFITLGRIRLAASRTRFDLYSSLSSNHRIWGFRKSRRCGSSLMNMPLPVDASGDLLNPIRVIVSVVRDD